MKKIVLSVPSDATLHKLWDFFYKPPKGYIYVGYDGKVIKKPNSNFAKTKHSFWNKFVAFVDIFKSKIPFLDYFIIYLYQKYISWKIDKLNPDLVYGLNGFIYRGKNSWISDYEHIIAYAGFHMSTLKKYKKNIEKLFLQSNCKQIIPYSQTSYDAFLGYFAVKLQKKLIISQNAISLPEKRIHIRNQKVFTVLFFGSTNIADNFNFRGGYEVVDSFIQFNKKFPDSKLIMRCTVPNDIRHKINAVSSIQLIEEPLPYDEFQELFFKSDVFMLPAYNGYALSIKEAMSYGLAIITNDFLENKEDVINNENGLKIFHPPIHYLAKNTPFYYDANNKKNILLSGSDFKVTVADLVSALEMLYTKPALLKKIKQNNVKKSFSFSFERKIASLKRIYELSLK